MNLIKRIFQAKEKVLMKTNLSSAQAIAIAKTADIESLFKENLSVATAVEENGKILWSVSSLSKGAQEIVYVDDETGVIVRTKHVGVR
ncbi:MAG: hypothetical protein GC149_01510 [Gammaproteobacteria bacterium]|nr:hypothetical protein [Gammaproteobacteria bacterium]